jgi:phosphohistidine phosphatase
MDLIMKILYLVRHAKSDWDNSSLSDIERPLNKRGEKDAPKMAKILSKKDIKPELLLSSPSIRTKTTAKYFCKELDYDYRNVTIDNKIYLASPKTLLDIINNIDNKLNSIMMFGHNPGITELVNILSSKSVDNVPTCGIAAMAFNVNHWNEIDESNSSLLFFEYPKEYK